MDAVIERLLPEPVARQQQGAIAGIPDGVGEHAAQLRNAAGAFFFVEVHQRFGVAVGFEAVAGAKQICAQFPEIVDLAVEDYPDGSVFIRHGLVAGREIDDAEPPHPEAAAAVDMIAFVIRAAIPDLIAHGADLGQIGVPLSQDLSGDATHT